ncbi:hypothetical protein TRVL_08292 [Trypanosoma vivax]|nr:hypothetical protein TRVL_08292 [Trypanosoma vivax]
MDVLVDTLKQAQQAVLHAQHDLITIRQQQRDDSVFASSLDCKDLLSLQLRSQSKQEDAIQYLEDGVKLLCHLVKDFSLQHNVGESSYANPEEEQTAMCAVKKAMRRYVEGQRNLQVEWEEKLREQISASNAFIISLRNSMVSFAQQAFMRRQKARVLQCWRLKAFRMRSLRERSSITRGLGKMRTIVAKSYASVKERSDLRVRCFYRWRVRYIYAMNARSEAEKVELKTELRRLEMEAEKHVKLVDELNCGKEEAERRLRCGQQEQKKELTRLKAVMNETVLEFSKRSDTYVQQQEEMTRHYEERGKLLAKQVVKAETESKKFKEGARLSAQCEDHMRMLMDITCTDVSEFSLLKAEAIQNEVLSVGLESVGRCCELQAQLREQEKQLKLLTTMEGHVASLEASSAEMKRQLDEQSKKIVELNLSLQRADERGLLRQCWSSWRKGISNRYREEALRTREVMFEQLVENEMISRRFLVQQQATSRETIIAQHEANAAEIVSEMRYIELVKVRNHCKQLQGENALERQSFERCREAYDTLMRELFDAQADSLNAKEQTMRTALRYDEQRVRQMLWARFTEDCTTMLTNCELNERRREKMLMQSALVATQFRLREVGGLVVEYCAREAFTCWLLYTERRKHCREKECMERRNSCNVAMAASALLWFDGSAEFILDTQQRKLKLVEAVMTHSALSHANGVLVRQQQLFEADVEVRLGQISSLWVAFATNAGCWCAAQEGLLVEAFCSGCSDTRTGAMGGIIAPLAERTKGFLSAEATILSDHVSGLMDAVQCVAVTALEEQRKRHEESTKEMLEYQSFLEQRITAAGMLGAVTTEFAQDTVVRVHIQRGALEKSELAFRELQSRVDRLQLECDLRERDWREREASLCEALERSKAACGDAQDRLAQVQLEFDLRERDWRERERSMRTALLKQRDCESKLSELESCCEEHVQCTQSVEGEASVANGEQQREVGMLQAENQQLKPCLDRPLVENSMNDAMRDLLSLYKRVLVAMETDVLSRRGEFASYAEALTDVEAFSKVLLLRYEEDLNQLMAEKRRVQLKGQEG